MCRLRLHRTRRALLLAELGSISISQVMHRQGFFEHGRFSAEYRRAFGELPSQMLARSCTTDVPLLLP